ncbi:hypothetical protein BD289DRAFT_438399 [Coniella lustricola]|uniref:Rhodopsin domain-containing protein n=1 Tax=Coniella lustricola TaxID=2025994 RepID=A0A2T3A2Z4_9PEZI|nr:hypothetical protein BD289DRAFT_438399 [Coniella lustricola]
MGQDGIFTSRATTKITSSPTRPWTTLVHVPSGTITATSGSLASWDSSSSSNATATASASARAYSPYMSAITSHAVYTPPQPSDSTTDRAGYIIAAQTACLVLVCVFVTLRTYTRTVVRPGNFGWEDGLLIASLVAFVLEAACIYQSMFCLSVCLCFSFFLLEERLQELLVSIAACFANALVLQQKTEVADGDGQHLINLTFDQISAVLEACLNSSTHPSIHPHTHTHTQTLNCDTNKHWVHWPTNPPKQDGYLSLLAYMLTICLVKLSLIMQYCRIFIDRATRTACQMTAVFIILFTLSTMLASVFSCAPVSSFWSWGTSARTCINYYALWYVHGGVNILTDFVVLLIPVPAIWTLHLPCRQKISSGLLLGFGSFGCIASIVRLYELWLISTDYIDSTFGDMQSVWCVIELAVCIICASATGLTPLYYDRLEPLVDHLLGRPSRRTMASGSQGLPYADSHALDSSATAVSQGTAKQGQGQGQGQGPAGYSLKLFSGWSRRRARQCAHSIHSAEDDANFTVSRDQDQDHERERERSAENVRMEDLLTSAAARSRVGGYAV